MQNQCNPHKISPKWKTVSIDINIKNLHCLSLSLSLLLHKCSYVLVWISFITVLLMSQDSVIVYNLTGYKLKYFHYKHMKIYIYCPKYSRNELVSYIYIYIFFVVFTCSIVKRKFRHRLRAQQDGEESLRKTFIYLFIYGPRREMVSSQDLCFPSSFPAKKLEMLEYILGDFFTFELKFQ